MFSFHKPKIYRSNLGCCICKAKSSSSRFTDSKKYENEFERCFRIQEKRSGEICNACVLLVKRWKKLSPENRLTKHWHHVVDARAGPGTKLTGNRRITSSSSSNSSQSSSVGQEHSANSERSNGSTASNAGGQSSKQRAGGKSDVLPLSSHTANNQHSSGSTSSFATKVRTSSFTKARAIDTNVSTFTFGEPPHRRNYMTTESGYSMSSSSISSFAKPQSALNSSAFESVIKRFRQRQQQQQIEAQRRLMNRQQRQQQRSNQIEQNQTNAACNNNKKQLPTQNTNEEFAKQPSNEPSKQPGKRLKRSSESIGTLTIDGLRVSSLLDGLIWRKEKICCGIIFRGLYNEVAIFPKLLKPCQDRLSGSNIQEDKNLDIKQTDSSDGDLLTNSIESPPQRTAKSGSISSCDSNTSGTGSMEQPIEESQLSGGKGFVGPVKRPRSSGGVGVKKQQEQQVFTRRRLIGDTDSNISSSSVASMSSTGNKSGRSAACMHSPSSSSGASSSRLLLMAEDDEEGDESMMEDEDTCESSNDATASSVESLPEMEGKKSDALAMG